MDSRYIPILLSLLLSFFFSQGKAVLQDLDLADGDWVIIGIPVHNYRAVPVQKDLGTFITKDKSLMQEIQQGWDLDLTFDDKCDYHYALKFYCNDVMVRTVKLNLYCGYLTSDGLSYEFAPQRFDEFKSHADPIDWSRISFADLNLLKKAVETLGSRPDIYWYEDVMPYKYSGFFMLAVNNLPWNASIDSLDLAMQQNLEGDIKDDDFYLKKYFHVIRGDKLYVRYMVNCDPFLAQRVAPEQRYLPWRSHLEQTDSVRIVAIGLNQERYRKLMSKQSRRKE